IFNFVLMFVGISTLDQVVVPVLNRFIKNVYIYNLKIWDTLEESFGEDRHALNQSPEFLSYANMMPDENRVRKCLVNTRVLAYSNLKDGQPWGLNICRCGNVACQGPAYNMIFHPHEHWLQTKMRYSCLQCSSIQRAIACPTWIHA
ncbi:hypothetical protein BD769DRAFT_1323306, partial [Suillus cothurnatus]